MAAYRSATPAGAKQLTHIALLAEKPYRRRPPATPLKYSCDADDSNKIFHVFHISHFRLNVCLHVGINDVAEST